MTIGEDRVRVTFNPSADSNVEKLKQAFAKLIDECEELKKLDARLAAVAQTHLETAAMYAIKAATTKRIEIR